MKFILSKEELEKGSPLFLLWTTDKYCLNEVYDQEKILNDQGYFTTVREDGFDDNSEPQYVIDVFQRKLPFIRIC